MMKNAVTITFKSCIEVDPDRVGGKPVLVGTRFTVAQLLSEIAEGGSVNDVVEEYDLDVDTANEVIDSIIDAFNKSLSPKNNVKKSKEFIIAVILATVSVTCAIISLNGKPFYGIVAFISGLISIYLIEYCRKREWVESPKPPWDSE